MGSAISTVYLGLAYCFCTASGNLCNACLGTTLQGTTGRKRAVLLLAITIVLSLFFQYKVAPSIVLNEGWIWKCYRAVPGMGKMVYKAWKDPYCESYEDQEVQCAGNAGVFRPTSLATLFFRVPSLPNSFLPLIEKHGWQNTQSSFSEYSLPCSFRMHRSLLDSFSGSHGWVLLCLCCCSKSF
mmetsp:Transcript_19148/g.34685  ORF Transcript_19148/g.34685 Transcript_19148/m.34685 type:complete len:183 (+) Transcript_19148:114-662(+)